MILARLAALFALVLVFPAATQDRRPSHCIALVENTPGLAVIHRASLTDPLPDYAVQLGYIDHAMYALRTREGTLAVTDYAGFIGSGDIVPDVVTMNRAHSTHWTPYPDPRIPHVLPGWTEDGSEANHYLDLGDLLVRSVSTDIRSYGGGENGNSIFVFESEGLCIGHLGHLHHEPTPEQYAAIGRLDVVMAPVDGGMTLDLPTMIRVLKRFRSSVVLPMHWFGPGSLERFLAGMADEFLIDRRAESFLTVSLQTLPSRPTVVVLQPRFLDHDH